MAVRAGKVRPSQAVMQQGPGSLADLPTLSMIMVTADHWHMGTASRIDEPRLARYLRVDSFRSPPWLDSATGVGGLPARVFPEYLVCPSCRRLAQASRFSFERGGGQPRFMCKSTSCPRQGRAIAYPARFMVACPQGHLDDFPWHQFVHAGVACNAELELRDSGRTGSIADLSIVCATHGAERNLAVAFGRGAGAALPACSGRMPWAPTASSEACTARPRVLLRGASNAYFAAIESAISIPPWSDPLQLALGQHVETLAKVGSVGDLEVLLRVANLPELEKFTPEQVWRALSTRRKPAVSPPTAEEMRLEEWHCLRAEPGQVDARAEFCARAESVPGEFGWVTRVSAIERLREVRALLGFTRIDPVPDIGEMGEVEALDAGLQRSVSPDKRWLPAAEFRGEGIFVELSEAAVTAWESLEAVRALNDLYCDQQEKWAARRGAPLGVVREARYLLVHSLSHLVMRQLALDCGYSGTDLRERIYSSPSDRGNMAGFLIYTASADSEGSLGGLVEMARPEDFGPIVARAIEGATLCAGDPHCAHGGWHAPAPGVSLNGAACHTCLFASETSCEVGNRHLDRGVVVSTLAGLTREFIAG